MRLAVFMDPIEHIKAYKDSSVAMLKSAQEQGIECYFFTPQDLYASAKGAVANSQKITVF